MIHTLGTWHLIFFCDDLFVFCSGSALLMVHMEVCKATTPLTWQATSAHSRVCENAKKVSLTLLKSQLLPTSQVISLRLWDFICRDTLALTLLLRVYASCQQLVKNHRRQQISVKLQGLSEINTGFKTEARSHREDQLKFSTQLTKTV